VLHNAAEQRGVLSINTGMKKISRAKAQRRKALPRF